MTDDSEIVLRWDDVRGKVKKVFNEGGFRWTVEVESEPDVSVTLCCDVDHDRSWNCVAKLVLKVYSGQNDNCCHWSAGDTAFHFSDTNCIWRSTTDQFYYTILRSAIEIKIEILSYERGKPIADPGKFGAPNSRSNVILKVEGVKLHVSKEYLAVHSPVFDTMFFCDFAEKNKEEVELKDVEYEEFLDLLHLIYPGTGVMDQSLKHLTLSTDFDTLTKLLLADQYGFPSLKDLWLQSFTSATELVEKIKAFPEYDKFSSDMKSAILDRIKKI